MAWFFLLNSGIVECLNSSVPAFLRATSGSHTPTGVPPFSLLLPRQTGNAAKPLPLDPSAVRGPPQYTHGHPHGGNHQGWERSDLPTGGASAIFMTAWMPAGRSCAAGSGTSGRKGGEAGRVATEPREHAVPLAARASKGIQDGVKNRPGWPWERRKGLGVREKPASVKTLPGAVYGAGRPMSWRAAICRRPGAASGCSRHEGYSSRSASSAPAQSASAPRRRPGR